MQKIEIVPIDSDLQIKLVIFQPIQHPVLWIEYIKGLQREYSRMKVDRILDLDELGKPENTSLAILAISDDDYIGGIRFHGPLKKEDDAKALIEMGLVNQKLMQKYLGKLIRDGITEFKGLWIKIDHSYRQQGLLPYQKALLMLMCRCAIYGGALLNCRYAIATSAQSMTQRYVKCGWQVIDEIGFVPYPNNSFKTYFGYFNLYNLLELSANNESELIKKEWQLILQAKKQIEREDICDRDRPIILDEANPFHSYTIETFLQDESYQKVDLLSSLNNELDKILPKVPDKLRTESPRWVIYPWRKIATRIIGPELFHRLRLDRNRNKITDTEQKKLLKLSIGVVGLSTGHVIAHSLVMEGLCGHLKLADFDSLELSNLNRIPSTIMDLGVNKAISSARRIAEMEPYISIETWTKGLDKHNINQFMEGLDIVVEECDSLDIKVLVREVAAKKGIPVLMSTSDLGLLDIERFDLNSSLKPFYGLINVEADELQGLSRKDKAGYALSIIDGHKISAHLAASMIEIDYSVRTWPQLASDVILGAAMVGTAVRRIGKQQSTPSGRIRFNIDTLLANNTVPGATSFIDRSSDFYPEFKGEPKSDILLSSKYAPSPGNIQPWNIYWNGDRLNIEINRLLTTSMDVHWRGAFSALGAATLNAKIAASHYNVLGDIEYFPVTENSDLISCLTLGHGSHESLKELFPYVLKRNTNRHLTKSQPLAIDVIQQLKKGIQQYPVNLHLLTTVEDLETYSKLCVESDRLRHICSHLHQEMMGELVWPGKDSLEEGIDVRTLEMKPQDLSKLSVIQRQDVMAELAEWNAGFALGEYNKDRILGSSAIALITIQNDQSRDYFIGGQACQHFWLLAEKYGIAIQPVSPIMLYANNQQDVRLLMKGKYEGDVWALRQQFNEIFTLSESENPVLLMRLTYADRPSIRSSRRSTIVNI